MTSFPLKIVTPDGPVFDGEAEVLTVRTTSGELSIMARHVNFLAPLGMGRATVVFGGQRRTAACIGGMVSVVEGQVTLVPTTFEWSDQIDLDRAQAAYDRAQSRLQDKNATDAQLRLAQAKLRRALIRRSVASSK